MNKVFEHSKGQMMVLYAGVLTVLLGATALCTDVAVMYLNSIQLQKGVDSAAIAGANFLNGLAFSGAAAGCDSQPDDAKKAACTYAFNNGLAVDGSLTITEPTSSTIQVTAQRTGLPYYFGKVLGLSTYDVSATSIARASQPVGTVNNGMFPVGLQCTSPCDLGSLNPGQSVTFGKKFVGGLAPGNWQFLAIGGTGDANLASAIQIGATGSYTLGSTVNTEPGNKGKSGPVKAALSDRLNKCASISDPCSAAGANPNDIPAGDPCLVLVPAVDFHGCNGTCTMTVEGFALIYLEQSTTSTSIQGCFVQAVTTATVTSSRAPQLGAEMGPTLIQ